MLKNKQRLLFAAILAAVPFTVQANITVDGNVGDWIDLTNIDNSYANSDAYEYADGSAYATEGNEWDALRSTTSYVIADSDDNNNNFYFDTNGTANNSKLTGSSGGQAYDAEAMYMEVQNNTLYIAIVTGLSPDNSGWRAGDIFFDLNGDVNSTTYNVEGATGTYNNWNHDTMTASDGDGYEYGLVVRQHNDNGFDDTDGNTWGAGGLYNVSEWNLAGVEAYASTDAPVSGSTGESVDGATTLVHSSEWVNGIGPFDYAGGSDPWAENDHYVIEASISLVDSSNPGQYNAFGQSLIDSLGSSGNDINVHWNPLCNNDWIQFTGTLAYNPPSSSGNPIPEPAPLALMAIGFIGMAARKKYTGNQ